MIVATSSPGRGRSSAPCRLLPGTPTVDGRRQVLSPELPRDGAPDWEALGPRGSRTTVVVETVPVPVGRSSPAETDFRSGGMARASTRSIIVPLPAFKAVTTTPGAP